MAVITINRVGEVGVVRDVAAHTLPLNAWSDGKNVRFLDAAAHKMQGSDQHLTDTQVVPYWLLPIPTPTQGLFFWLYAGLAKVYAMDQAGLYYNLTRQTEGADDDYTGAIDNRWNGGVFSGIPVVNNGVDLPQVWTPMSTAQPLQALANWPTTYRARTMIPFKSFLVALWINKGGIDYPRLVKWSAPADPGTVPATWDETDETNDAGEYDLSETGDSLVDGIPLGDVLALYKENSVWAMQYVGGVWVFRFQRLLPSVGVLNTGWVIELSRTEHLVFTGDDLVVFNGTNTASVLQGRWRKWLRANLSGTYFKRAFLVKNILQNEAWLCIPSGDATLPDKALIWNWETRSITLRDLPGQASFGSYSLDKDLAQRRLLLADPTNSRLVYADETETFSGTAMEAFLERTDMGLPLKESEPPDLSTSKIHRRLFPRITGTVGGVVKVYTACYDVPLSEGQVPSYDAGQDFTIGTTKFLDINRTGTLLALKFKSDTDITWALHGYSVDVDSAGKKSH